jgi:RNA polymerase sigma-70 factor (ECF subfamily)
MTAALDLPGLLAAVAAGDRAALRSLCERQSSRLFGVANAILRDRDLAAEALREGLG